MGFSPEWNEYQIKDHWNRDVWGIGVCWGWGLLWMNKFYWQRGLDLVNFTICQSSFWCILCGSRQSRVVLDFGLLKWVLYGWVGSCKCGIFQDWLNFPCCRGFQSYCRINRVFWEMNCIVSSWTDYFFHAGQVVLT